MQSEDVLEFEYEEEAFYLRVRTRHGEVEVMANAAERPDVLYLTGLHLEGPGANQIGTGEFLRLAREFAEFCMEQTDAQKIIIQGFRRSTGANPGHIPRTVSFRR